MKFKAERLVQIAGPAGSLLLAAGVVDPLWGWWGGVTVAHLLLATILSFIAMRHSRWWLLLTIFFFNDPAAPEIYALSLHDALPISPVSGITGGGDVSNRFSFTFEDHG